MQKRINRGKHFDTHAAYRRHGSRMLRPAPAVAVEVQPMEGRILMDATATFDYHAEPIPLQAISLNLGDPGVKPLDQLVNRPDDDYAPDDVSQALDLGSDNRFTLYGTAYRQLWVSTNGLITLGDDLLDQNAQYFNDGLDTLVTQPAIAPQWDDWRAFPAGSGVFYKLEKNQLTIEWKSLDHYPGTTDYVTFQAVLQLNTGSVPGDIIFNYPDLDAGVIPGVESFSNGASATIGIKDRTPLGFGAVPQRLVVSNNVGTNELVHTGKAIRIAANKPPVLDSLADVSVPEGATVTLTASATDPDPGDVLTYDWDLNGRSDDGFEVSGRTPTFDASRLDGPSQVTVGVRVSDGHGHTVIGTGEVNILNVAPTVFAETFDGLEDRPLDGTLRMSDPGDDHAELTAALVVGSGPAHGSATLNADGTFTYVPEANYNGPDQFSYRVSDNDGGTSSPATVTLRVAPVNDAPVAGDDRVVVDEDAVGLILPADLLDNDADVDGDALAVVFVGAASHGTVTRRDDGVLMYTPDANYHGTDWFTYRAGDGAAQSTDATVNVTVNSVNDAPAAADDTYATDEDVTLTVGASAGLLANDNDVDGDALSASVVDGPAHGTLLLNATGGFTYTPDKNYFGADAFSYTASDGEQNGASAPTVVTLTVNPVNDTPIAAVDAYETNEDTPLAVAAPGVLVNDSDADGDTLSAVLVSGPAHGALTLNTDGSFSYQPSKDFNGDDWFSYRPSDGTASGDAVAVALRVAPVNDAPVSADDSAATAEDSSLTIGLDSLLANDSDVEGDALTANVATGPSHGTLTPNADGTLTYTPAVDFNGTDSFTYRASDGSAVGNAATVTIRVTPVNDATAAAADNYELDEDGSLAVNAPGILANDSDVDGDALIAQVATGPGHGTLTLGADGSFRYTPEANYHGPDSFTYRAADSAAGSVATVSLTVRSVNDAPQAGDDAYATAQGVPVATAKPGVLDNDTDPDGDPLRAVVKVQPAHGTLSLADDGSFTYVPGAGYSGEDWFTYAASDGSAESAPATVRFTIAPGNALPVAFADEKSTAQDTPLTFDPLANDTDADGDALKLDATPQPQFGTVSSPDGRSLVYQPRTGFYGTDSFEYRVSDGHGGSATATVTVTVTRAAAGSVYLINDPTYPGKTALVVNGTDGADSISVTAATGGVQVSFSGTSRGVYGPTGRIIVYGYAGSDTIQVGGSVPNVSWLYGDSGNDSLSLGNGGGLAFGGSGDDSINGGSGRDIIVGGNGGDRIVGNPGDDILISAVTIYDSRFSAASHNTAWSKLYAEWTSLRNFATRICNLSGPTTTGLNDVFRLNDSTVNDDLDTDVMDVLTGASGEDWFIYKYGEDRITNLSTMEIQNDLQIN